MADARTPEALRPRLARARARSTRLVAYLSGVPSTSKHGIVAGALALELQPAAQHPHERIEPACSAQDLCGDLGAPVSAPHMRQFVTEHQSGAVVSPMSCPSGNHHGWRAPSPRGKKRRMVDLQQPHGTAKAKAIRRFCQRQDPCRLDHRRGAPREPGEPAEADAQSHEKVSEPEKPNGGRYQRQLARRGQPPRGRRAFGGKGRAYDGSWAGLTRSGAIERRHHRGGGRRCGPGEGPRRHKRSEQRQGQCTCHGRDEHAVTEGCRPLAQERHRGEHDANQNRHFDGRKDQDQRHASSFLAFATRSAILFSSFSDSLGPSPPRSAPTTFSTEPSKNVSTR